MAPVISAWLFCHLYVMVPELVAVTENEAVVPSAVVLAWGWAVIEQRYLNFRWNREQRQNKSL